MCLFLGWIAEGNVPQYKKFANKLKSNKNILRKKNGKPESTSAGNYDLETENLSIKNSSELKGKATTKATLRRVKIGRIKKSK